MPPWPASDPASPSTSSKNRPSEARLRPDFSPASIEYARNFAQAQQLACEYQLADVRYADYGAGYDLAMFVFGEPNVFRPDDLRRILSKAYAALNDGGHILLEVHTWDVVQRLGHQRAAWYTLEHGLFSDRPHLVLFDSYWDEAQAVAIERFYIVDAETHEVTAHSSSMQAYTDEQYRYALQIASFTDITFYPSLIGAPDERQPDLFAIAARK
ncbi:MAG: class I SAM-dependent methyltransferase [Chloroflexi bacterium]|nr:class I SAM-dependent methyltransferase [Chloroflexota bacterium]